MSTFAKATGAVVLPLALFVLWYTVAADYGDSVTSGTYHLSQNGETSTLVLKPDHTFRQELSRSGELRRAEGSWRRIGEGGVVFSKEFLAVSGQELDPDGTAIADLKKKFGFLVSLEMRQYYVWWYERVDPSPGSTAYGTYSSEQAGVQASLILKQDHMFEQTVSRVPGVKQANGTWTTTQNGDIVFSSGFLKTSGEPLNQNETASAMDPRGSVLQIEIAATSKSGVPTFRKEQFTWSRLHRW